MISFDENLRKQLKAELLSRGTIRDAAKEVGMTPARLGSFLSHERGKFPNFDAVCEYLGVKSIEIVFPKATEPKNRVKMDKHIRFSMFSLKRENLLCKWFRPKGD